MQACRADIGEARNHFLPFDASAHAHLVGNRIDGDAGQLSDVDEDRLLERVAPLIANGLRQALLAQPALPPADRGPGLVLIDETGEIVSATREAAAWLDEVDSGFVFASPAGVPMPLEARAYAARVRAAAREDGGGAVPRARLRTRAGVWLLMHGSMLQGSEQLALIIEPAKAADVAPLIVEAYRFTTRELDVTRLIARGLGTSQIAASLILSPHTVRDHVKAVFEKVGVPAGASSWRRSSPTTTDRAASGDRGARRLSVRGRHPRPVSRDSAIEGSALARAQPSCRRFPSAADSRSAPEGWSFW